MHRGSIYPSFHTVVNKRRKRGKQISGGIHQWVAARVVRREINKIVNKGGARNRGGNLDRGWGRGPHRGINNDERAKGQSGACRVYVTMPHYAYEYKCTLGGGRNKCRPQRIPEFWPNPCYTRGALPAEQRK